ncbi:MAG: imidazole glycerol phosphate synthase subunit HisF [Candidatus Eremiobacteraeota bacterium]|nr:imidazole glycerol phosphate synthase subunit HisF [Candidatus Eremiobacteraeota bacterium]
MLTRRIVPCLDIKGGRVVKGVNFVALRDAGDPVELAKTYEASGADELVFLDITATVEGRQATRDVVRAVARELTIPFAVGGGVSAVEDVRDLLRAGCDKVALNSSAVRRPDLLREAAAEFGSQCIILAVDARALGTGWEVVVDGGRTSTGLDVLAWVAEATRDGGAGEVLVTSMDRDGTKIGYDLALTAAVRAATSVPVIASGGAGSIADFADVFERADADAALAASLFHFGEVAIPDLKAALAARGIPMRPWKAGVR